MSDQKELRIACISDIHLGHKRNKAKDIIKNLDTYLNNDKFLKSIDLLILAGDVFDELLHVSSEDMDHIDFWIAKLLRKCQRFGIYVRVLEGTPSHDRGQSRRFVVVNEINRKAGQIDAQLKYIDTLSIEYIPKFDIHVLYMPDEWGPTAQDTLDQVRTLLVQHQLTQVDYGVFHGCFGYQLPSHIPHIPRHSEEDYLGIVSRLIFIGHVHTHTTYDRIVAQGSFDRLSHNEEEPKGFVKAVVQPNGEYTLTFIENKGACIYKTITCRDESVTESLMMIENQIQGLPYESNVRIEAFHTNPILSNLSVIKERWPLLNWTVIARGKEAKENPVFLDHKNVYVPIVLDRQSISRVILERIAPLGLNPLVYQQCQEHLKETVGG